MIQDIKFQGLSNSPSDNSVQDGELGTCLNLIPEDGELKPIAGTEVVDEGMFLTEDTTIEYIHKVNYDDEIISHYICYDDLNDIWFWHLLGEPVEDIYQIQLPEADKFHVNSVTSIGNILCFVGDDDIWYAFWDSNVKTYKEFNKSQFKLSLKITMEVHTDEALTEVIKLDDEEFWSIFEKAYKNIDKSEELSYPVRTKANKTIEIFNKADALFNKRLDELGDKYFKYTSVLVAAVRLYDGNYLYLSPLCILDVGQSVTGGGIETGGGISSAVDCRPEISYWIWREKDYVGNDPTMKKNSKGLIASIGFSRFWLEATMNISGFEKIIDGIDVYITKCESFWKLNGSLELGMPDNLINQRRRLPFTYTQGREFANNLDSLSFYKSLHITNQQLGEKISIKRVLGTEESISLANAQFKNFGGIVTNSYNNRLHIANIKESVNLDSLGLPYYVWDDNKDDEENWECDLVLKFSDEDGKSLFFRYSGILDNNNRLIISVPVVGYKFVETFGKIHNHDGLYDYKYAKLILYQSDNIGYCFYANVNQTLGFRSFSYAFGMESTKDVFEEAWNSASTATNIISRSPSLIKVSEAENPLVFPASNSVQVGSSVIKAMAANTRPITEGQFGDAPLYVFTDEGTWMLMLSAEGKYQARQPVNRDVCSNPKGILQIDDAVLFPTERGIMMQTGSTSKLITDVLDGTVFDYTQLYKEEYSKKILAVRDIPEGAIKYVPFRQFMQNADMVYDYYDGRIIVFNPSCRYAYVYSLKSGLWGTMESDIKKRINIYPESYAINGHNQIVDFYQSQPTDAVTYFLCTRPMSISGAEVYKTMFSCITRGYFRNEPGKCGMALYGSNDLFRWFPISTSVNKYLRGMCGSPYKYFRLALIGSLLPEERLNGLSADFQERWQNKLR